MNANVELLAVEESTNNKQIHNVLNYQKGATILSIEFEGKQDTETDFKEAAQKLFSSDLVSEFKIPASNYKMVLKLDKNYFLDELFFDNTTIIGNLKVTLAQNLTDQELQEWSGEVQLIDLVPGSTPSIPLNGTQAQYLLLEFKSEAGGFISDLRMLGVSANSTNETQSQGMSNGARVLFVSSGDVKNAYALLDDDYRTAYKFDGGDKSPVAIVEFGSQVDVSKISSRLKSSRGTMEYYLLNSLPEELSVSNLKSKKETFRLPLNFFEKNIPIAELNFDQLGEKSTQVEFDKSISSQYLVIRYRHDFPQRKGLHSLLNQPIFLSLSEVRVFESDVYQVLSSDPEISSLQEYSSSRVQGASTSFSIPSVNIVSPSTVE